MLPCLSFLLTPRVTFLTFFLLFYFFSTLFPFPWFWLNPALYQVAKKSLLLFVKSRCRWKLSPQYPLCSFRLPHCLWYLCVLSQCTLAVCLSHFICVSSPHCTLDYWAPPAGRGWCSHPGGLSLDPHPPHTRWCSMLMIDKHKDKHKDKYKDRRTLTRPHTPHGDAHESADEFLWALLDLLEVLLFLQHLQWNTRSKKLIKTKLTGQKYIAEISILLMAFLGPKKFTHMNFAAQ